MLTIAKETIYTHHDAVVAVSMARSHPVAASGS